jgi:hypothetical protein
LNRNILTYPHNGHAPSPLSNVEDNDQQAVESVFNNSNNSIATPSTLSTSAFHYFDTNYMVLQTNFNTEKNKCIPYSTKVEAQRERQIWTDVQRHWASQPIGTNNSVDFASKVRIFFIIVNA